ncbi:MAG: glycoside hydrolase family 9 protein [Myxococcaceae bacterium]
MRGRTRARLALLLALAALAGLAVAGPFGLRHLERRAGARLLGAARLYTRRLAPKEPPLFSHLACSQVGYGPSARKHFTSPLPFASFVVLEEATGALAFKGQGPGQQRQTDVLGPFSTVFVGDFSALRQPGRYRVRADNGLESFPFSVGADVFDAPLRAVQRWFYYQRAFTSVQAPYAEGPWTHPSDADKAPAGVRGGWHDAGDFSLYSASLNQALFWLLLSAADFPQGTDDSHIPESGNGLPDVLDEARWGLTWLLSVQEASGGFQNTTCQEAYGPYGTNTPNSVPVYKNGEVGTLATARAVGNLALAAVLFRPLDAAFSEVCLRAAWAGVGYLDAHAQEDSDGPSCSSFRADGDREVGRRARSFAAAGMLWATSQPRFSRAFEETFVEPDYDVPFLHLSGQAALLYLHAPAGDAARKQALWARLRANADVARREGARHPFGWAGRYHWGSLGAGFLRAALSSVPVCRKAPSTAQEDCEQALASLHYAFGRNLRQFCYVTGLPGTGRSMRWGFHQWLETLDAQPRDFPGMVAGGPALKPEAKDVSTPQARPVPAWGYWGDPAFPRDGQTPVDARATDNDSWSTNEPSVEWEAEAVYLLSFARWHAQAGARPSPP